MEKIYNGGYGELLTTSCEKQIFTAQKATDLNISENISIENNR